MKKWIALSSLLLVAIMAGGAVALFTNGGFELGDLSGWTVEHGINSAGLTVAVENGVTVPVAENVTWLSGVDPSLDNTWYFGEFGNLERTAVTGLADNGLMARNLSPVKYQQHSVRVNSPDGERHAHRISQESVLTAADRDSSDGRFHVRFAWAAVLENPGHDAGGQPYFHLNLLKTNDNTVLYSKFFYSNQPGFPWRSDNTVYGGWLWIDWQEVDLDITDNVVVGDTIRIELSVGDCRYSGHGGYAFLDGFRSQASAIQVVGGGEGVLGNGCGVVFGVDGKATRHPVSDVAMLGLTVGLFLLPVGILRRLHRRRSLPGGAAGPLLILLAVLLVAAAAEASAPAVPKGQRFHPTTDGLGAVTVDSAETLGQGKMAFGVTVNTAHQPVNTGDIVNLEVKGDIVKQLWTLDVTGAYGFTPDFEVGVDVKANHVSDGRNFKTGLDDTNTTWGDIRLNGKYRFVSRGRYGLAVIPFANFPAGNRDYLLSEVKFGAGLKLAGHYAASDKLKLYANAGVEHIGTAVRRSYTPWIQYGVGASYALPWRKDSLALEVNGETIWDEPWSDTIVNPVEALGAYRYAAATPGLTFQLGGGGGLNKGIGAPRWRGFVGVAYQR